MHAFYLPWTSNAAKYFESALADKQVHYLNVYKDNKRRVLSDFQNYSLRLQSYHSSFHTLYFPKKLFVASCDEKLFVVFRKNKLHRKLDRKERKREGKGKKDT